MVRSVQEDTPSKRYQIGLIHPAGNSESLLEAVGEEPLLKTDFLGPTGDYDLGSGRDSEQEDYSGSAENVEDHTSNAVHASDHGPDARRKRRKQTSFGLSFLAPKGAAIIRAQFKACSYKPHMLYGQPSASTDRIWTRHQLAQTVNVSLASSIQLAQIVVGSLTIGLTTSSSQGPTPDSIFVTVRVTNLSKPEATSHKDESIAFEAELALSLESSDGAKQAFVPFPDELDGAPGLLFHHEPIYSRGHGTAVVWPTTEVNVHQLRTSFLPSVKIGTVSSDPFHAPINTLATETWLCQTYTNSNSSDEWLKLLEAMGRQYLEWVSHLENEVDQLPEGYRELGRKHIAGCDEASTRFQRGLALIRDREDVRRAFSLTNQSFEISRRGVSHQSKNVSWRPFQLFFLVMNLVGLSDANSEDRMLVDLIWLPTGGGKTEAYLAVAAFTIWMRRINGGCDGVSVFMRYTLRLLTAQQFQRAAKLICAMESIRQRSFIGQAPIEIGIWIGGDQLPNSHKKALEKLIEMEKQQDLGLAVNFFGISTCPACNEPIGPLAQKAPLRTVATQRRKRSDAFGETPVRNTIAGIRGKPNGIGVELYCPSATCQFHTRLPLLVVDEDIYENPPDFLLATVDKIAITAWNPRARAIFGIGADGERLQRSFDLIIQDELHLIAGPLGTAFSMYEPLVEILGNHGGDTMAPAHYPKIICSTATVSEYQKQIQQLFGRGTSHLFPPPGFRHGETYFTTAFSDANHELNDGTTYVGIYSPEFQSAQTAQAIALAATVSAGDVLKVQGGLTDPWWTTVAFFNSLRELGYAVTLVETDIPDYLRVWADRNPVFQRGSMPLLKAELTSRIPSHEIPDRLKELEVSYPDTSAIDICLASTMIEVGIDVDRLSLMAVLGQPNSTARYIQVTGRVGRNWRNAPGVVVTVYGLGKARDLSHYEHFQSYHRRLYADVTPTLLAPFIEPALVKFLAGTAAAYLRQTMPIHSVKQNQSFAADAKDLEIWARTYLNRSKDFERLSETNRHVETILQQVESWNLESRMWAQEPFKGINLETPPIICRADDADAAALGHRVWRVPTSLRDVETNVSIVPSAHKKLVLSLGHTSEAGDEN